MAYDPNTYLTAPKSRPGLGALAPIDPRRGALLTQDQRMMLEPLLMNGWNMGGHGGGYGYGGGYGQNGNGYGNQADEPGRIGSAAGPLGSAGVPTSQRGRAEKYGDAAADVPTWQMSQNLEGQNFENRFPMAPSNWRNGGAHSWGSTPQMNPTDAAKHQELMGQAADFQPVQQPQSSSGQWWNPLAMARSWLNPFNL